MKEPVKYIFLHMHRRGIDEYISMANVDYHQWITLWVFFFLFIEAICVCYRKYRSAKNKKLLFELKEKRLELIPL